MEAPELLNEIFKRIGIEFGFDDVNAEYVAFKELKIRWKSSSKWASFEVSDYLANMPENLIEDLAEYVFSKIRNEDRKYPQSVSDWLADPSFLRIYQPLYLKRSGKVLTQSPEGRYADLRDSYERLIAFELVEKDDDIFFSWTKGENVRKVGHCTVVMKVVSISSELDSEDVPKFVLDFCVYHELCHIMIGYDPGSEKHDKEFDELLKRYPKSKEAEDWIVNAGLYL